MALKKINSDLKILISVGGWTWSKNFSDAVLTDTANRNFTQSAVDIVANHNLDGVDMDWEYPDIENRSAEDNVALMRQLGDSLHAANKELTAAVVHYGNQGE